ncbi:hypothetical protein [Rhodopseudomonas parapalustris]
MTLDDLYEDFCFRQADVLELVPGLNQGMLQNWKARGYFDVDPDEGAQPLADRRGKHLKSVWSGSGIIGMRFVMELGRVGIKPSEAFGLIDSFVPYVEGFMERFKPSLNEATGIEEYTFESDRLQDYHRVEIVRQDNGKLSVSMPEADASKSLMLKALLSHHITSVTVESDILFMVTLNGIIRHTAGRDRQTGSRASKSEE